MNSRRETYGLRAGFFLLALIASPLARAADMATPAVLAATCVNCHGPGGASPGPIPSINEFAAKDLAAMLKGFRSGATPATVMTRIAKGYTDAEIDALGQYFASLPH